MRVVGVLRSPTKLSLPFLRLWMLLLAAFLLLTTGCSTQKFLIRRDTPANPLSAQLQLASKQGPRISPRTKAVLRRFALEELYDADPRECLEAMQSLMEDEVENGLVYSISEIAYILGKKAERDDQQSQALDMYGVAVSNAYMYYFPKSSMQSETPMIHNLGAPVISTTNPLNRHCD